MDSLKSERLLVKSKIHELQSRTLRHEDCWIVGTKQKKSLTSVDSKRNLLKENRLHEIRDRSPFVERNAIIFEFGTKQNRANTVTPRQNYSFQNGNQSDVFFLKSEESIFVFEMPHSSCRALKFQVVGYQSFPQSFSLNCMISLVFGAGEMKNEMRSATPSYAKITLYKVRRPYYRAVFN